VTRYITQWDDATVAGGLPVGWTRRWQASVNPANAVPDVVYKRLIVKRRAVSYKEAATNFPAAITYDALDTDANRANIEILTAVKVDQTSPSADFCLWTRGTGTTAGTENAYRAQLSFSTSSAPNQVFLVKIIAGAATVITSAGFTFDSTKTYWARFRVNGTTLSLFVWAEGTDEPTTPTLTASDAAVAAAGFTGFQWTRPALANQIGYVNFFSVGTNGDTAVKPRTDLEFNAWLDSQTADRRVLAEMSATGYDSSGSPFTKTVNVYIANGGYTSQAWDSPASRHYDAWISGLPNFHREMSVTAGGKATTGFGSLVVANPATDTSAQAGVRDNWLRMKWKRDYLRMYLGDVTWPKHDFRLILLGHLAPPVAGKINTIEFPITDLLDLLDKPLQTNRYLSTDAVPLSLKPLIAGWLAYMEPVPTTPAGLELQFNDGSIFFVGELFDAGAGGASLVSSLRTVSAVNTATETISTATAHGGSVDARVIFTAGTPPAPLAIGVDYFIIAAGLTTTDFRVAATRGGAAINLTVATTGATFKIAPWWNDYTNGKVTVTQSPAGRIIAKDVYQRDGATSYGISPGGVVDQLVFTKYALAQAFRDPDAFTALAGYSDLTCGIAFYDEQVSALDALDRVCRGMNCWYGFTPDGLLQIGVLDLPAATAALTLTQSDVKDLKLVQRLLPVNRATLATRYARRWLRSGSLNLPPNSVTTDLLTEYTTLVGSAWPAAGIPLDDRPQQGDVFDRDPQDTLFYSTGFPGAVGRLESLFKWPIGIFSFQTRFGAIRDTVTIGSTIQLTHPRKGWKTWNAGDPASPDNTATVDSTKAVVLGIDVNFGSKSPMPVTLKVFRQMPGYYPTADLN
jgi:hypothetical protein